MKLFQKIFKKKFKRKRETANIHNYDIANMIEAWGEVIPNAEIIVETTNKTNHIKISNALIYTDVDGNIVIVVE